VTLPADWQKHALALIPRARTVNGDFFRSVELSYALPDDVISGEGSRQHGGRFVKPGVRAVYGSAEEQTAVAEAAYRRRRLAAGSVIAELPRIMYVISVKVGTAVDLTAVDPDVEALLPAWVLTDVSDSQVIGEFLRERSVQAIMFPSAAPGVTGTNIVVFRDVAPKPDLVLVNRDRILEEFRRLSRRLP
jgi:RES domain-containing protein